MKDISFRERKAQQMAAWESFSRRRALAERDATYRSIDKFECFKSRVRIPSQEDWESREVPSPEAPETPTKPLATVCTMCGSHGSGNLFSNRIGCRHSGTLSLNFVLKVRRVSSSSAARYIPEGGYGFSVLEPILMARLRPSTATPSHGPTERAKVERQHLYATTRPATSKPSSTMPVRSTRVHEQRSARVAAEMGYKERALRRANELIEEQRTLNGKVECLKKILLQKQRMEKMARSRARRQERIDDAYTRGEYYPVKAKTAEDEQARLTELIEAMRDDVIDRDNMFRDEMDSFTIHVGNKANGTAMLQAPRLTAADSSKRALEVLTVNSYGGLLGKVPRASLLKGMRADELIYNTNDGHCIFDNDAEQSRAIINQFDRIHSIKPGK